MVEVEGVRGGEGVGKVVLARGGGGGGVMPRGGVGG